VSAHPPQIDLSGQRQYRIIPSTFPTINFFEELVDDDEIETLFEIESLTNERIRQEVGDIFAVAPSDRVSGAGASVVMAAFTHIHKPSRFTDGTFGIYYAGMTIETAIKETVFQREIFLKATNEAACEIAMRVYEGKITKPFYDVRSPAFKNLHHASDFAESQLFGKQLKHSNAWGLIYNSVRHAGGQCMAAFRPPAISIPKPITHLKYLWNGKNITAIHNTKEVLTL
jgi:hypothetical protein